MANYKTEFDQRQLTHIEWARKYATEKDADGKLVWSHGANGHNDLIIIGKLVTKVETYEDDLAALRAYFEKSFDFVGEGTQYALLMMPGSNRWTHLDAGSAWDYMLDVDMEVHRLCNSLSEDSLIECNTKFAVAFNATRAVT